MGIVEDSNFTVGDDALCVKSGLDYLGRAYATPSQDIIFRRLKIGAGHGISVGSETSGGVRNVTFQDISMTGTQTGIRLKTQRGRGGVVEGLTYRNITMRRLTSQCVQMTMFYHAGLRPTNASATPALRNVLIEGVSCETAQNSFLIE